MPVPRVWQLLHKGKLLPEGTLATLLHKRECCYTHPCSTRSLSISTWSDLSTPIGFEGFSRSNILAVFRTYLYAKKFRHSKIKKKKKLMSKSLQCRNMLPEKGALDKVEVFKTSALALHLYICFKYTYHQCSFLPL